MRSRMMVLVAAAAVLVAPRFAAASDDIEEQLKLMNERMGQLETQLQATQDELDASSTEVARQQELIEKAGIEREAQSGVSKFFSEVEIGGWLATSWWWNFAAPGTGDPAVLPSQNNSQQFGTGMNQGSTGAFMPFHPDHNSFSVDQLWFEIEKPVTAESRGGFRADLVYGKTASLLGFGLQRAIGATPSECVDDDVDIDSDVCFGDSASDFNLFQAYVEWLAAPDHGISFKMGKFATPIGAESVGTVYNYNITRSQNWSLLQPINHYGIMMDGESGGFDYHLGVVNQGTGIDPDFNNEKSLLADVGYGGETYHVKAAVLWDIGTPGEDSPNTTAFNVVANWDPTERFSSYLDFTYIWAPDGVSCTGACGGGSALTDGSAWGLALAGRMAITEALGFALRGEILGDTNNYLGLSIPTASQNITNIVWGLTGTVDYALTDNLTVKGEVRWDAVDKDSTSAGKDNEFINKNGDFTNDDQVVTGIEVVYQF